jgi:hypothetical protein
MACAVLAAALATPWQASDLSAAYRDVMAAPPIWVVAQIRPASNHPRDVVIYSDDVLKANDVETWLPCRQRRVHDCGPSHFVRTPLFADYIFIHGDAKARLRAWETHRLANWLFDPIQSRLAREIEALQMALANDPTCEAVFGIKPGEPCVILPPHAMQGKRGTFEGCGKRGRVFVGITCVGGYVPLEIDRDLIEVIRDEQPQRRPRREMVAA